MKKSIISASIASILSLSLVACDSGTDTAMEQPAAPAAPMSEESTPAETDSGELKQTAKEWTEKTGELATEAWDATKETASDVGDKSKEYYEAAKEKTADMTETVVETSKEYYEAGKEKAGEMTESVVETSKDVYEAAKEKGTEMMSDTSEPAATTEITEQAETTMDQMTVPQTAE